MTKVVPEIANVQPLKNLLCPPWNGVGAMSSRTCTIGHACYSITMSRRICLILTASLALVGCDLANKQDAQYDDSRNPYYRQAAQDLDNNNPAAAAADYEAALGANPKLAGAHYQLGIIYGEKLQDPIGSIFHFKRFLELAPNSDQADKVKDLIDKQSQAFAAGLPNSPAQNADDYAKLQADNAALKKQVDDATHTITQLQAQLVEESKHQTAPTVVAPPPASPAVSMKPPPAPVADNNASNGPMTVPAPSSASTASTIPPRALPVDTNAPDINAPPSAASIANSGPTRTYKVVKGDSLWKIASKMYPGDTKNGVDKIQEANKDAIDGKPLKIGQVLIIPQ